ITNAPIAHMAIVWAKTEEGVKGFIVERGTEGFETPEIKEKMSLRFSPTGEIVLEDCFVPEENLLPGSSVCMKAPLLLSY
ncbi:MAG TPA: acyl-CoA dehydrogenase, partial [Thermosulfidibacter takaii]|nr:acyl-CoA dehydrogenase [Thermosulfidibacter takaii]